jgi:phosphate transport system permease protein
VRRFLRDLTERFIEGILTLSGTVTSLTVLLIVVFLFKEGVSLFSTSPVEEGTVIAVNRSNPVKHLTPSQIKNIFDQNTVNWKELGGRDEDILIVTVNDLGSYFTEEDLGAEFEFLPQKFSGLIDSLPNIIAVLNRKQMATDFKGTEIDVDKNNLPQFIAGKEWFPTSEPAVQLGVMPLLLGTLLVSFFAILIALPVGLATAIYMAEIADERIRKVLKPVVELLAGIPSVVYGFFGLIIIVPLIHDSFDLPVGETALAGSLVLAIMALPTIITISEDAMRNTPRSMREASLALGANKWQTINRVVLPYSLSGISAAAILGIGRAIGETMAVLMVTGNAAVIPTSLLQPVRTIPATIAAELGEAPAGGVHYKALFALGCLLFLMTMIINLWVERISAKRKFKK